ncbi:MAG: DUF58 domain-containing protein [Deltaproteobacteria bacterium]|nr:DUF58 domain-containing protein [Deltaproteobacteria bacterium]
MIPSARLLVLCAVATALVAAAGSVFPIGAWAIVAVDGLLVALALLDAAVVARVPVPRLTRQVPRRLAVARRCQVTIRADHGGDRTALRRTRVPLRVQVRDAYPATFTVTRDTLHGWLRPDSALEVDYHVVPPSRGRASFGDIEYRLSTALGFVERQGTAAAAADITVYPDTKHQAAKLAAMRMDSPRDVGLRNLRRPGGGGEFEKLRDYQPDDSYRDIDWKATARRHKPITRAKEIERSQDVILCVDAGRMMATRLGPHDKLDYAAEAAMLLAFVALRSDDRVGVVLFSDQVLAYLPPAKGRAHYRKILDVLSGVEPALTFVDYRAMARHVLARIRRRALCILITDLFDGVQAAPLYDAAKHLTQRHLCLCVTVRDPSLGRAESAPPAEAGDVYTRAVAVELLEERERLAQIIAAHGMRVMDTTPDTVAVQMINRYLEIKRTQRL